MPSADDIASETGKAKLFLATSENDPASSVVFRFSPATIKINHRAPMQTSTSKPGDKEHGSGGSHRVLVVNADEWPRANGVTSIDVNGVTFDGANVTTDCLKLLKWSHFQEVNDPNDTQKVDQYPLKFMWGTSQTYLVNLSSVTITYTRFSRSGTPVRATVDLGLHGIPDEKTPTNPTSGGPPGRRSHLLTGAETLPELATRTYGRPGRWREIAAANGIQDPLRVRPGTVVYLPSTQEGGR